MNSILHSPQRGHESIFAFVFPCIVFGMVEWKGMKRDEKELKKMKMLFGLYKREFKRDEIFELKN